MLRGAPGWYAGVVGPSTGEQSASLGHDGSRLNADPQGEIFELGRSDRESAAGLLARAFRDSPLNRAVIGEGPNRRLRCNRHGMRALLQSAEASARILGASPRNGGRTLQAALLAAGPGDYPLPMPSWSQQFRCLLGQGARVATRWGEVHRALEAVHPEKPQWYLNVLGVAPPVQGQGVGSGLLAHWLAEVDLADGSAYLETDRPENLPFYGRAGFSVVNEIPVIGVTVWCMARVSRNAENPGVLD